MRFGKIDYLNLLPFEVFIKSYPLPSSFKLFYQKKKSYPAKLNQEFIFGRIDAGFVSSITALNQKRYKFYAHNIGIVARKKVLSVIALKNQSGSDYQSDTSNALLKVLGIRGRVLIGDRALKVVLKEQKEGKKDYIDMGEFWVKKHNLPFVFGRVCIKKHREFYIKVFKKFQNSHIKIPHYILLESALKNDLFKNDILEYLKVLSYKIDTKANYGVNRFYRALRIAQIKPPKRF